MNSRDPKLILCNKQKMETTSKLPRARANTLERTEYLRPPPRKRRPSQELEAENLRPLRSGSVPPALEPSKMEILHSDLEQPSRPRRMRRLTTRLALDSNFTASQPSSGHNTPSANTTSALDLCQLAPFGTLETSNIQKGS